MLKKETIEVIERSKEQSWILEPDAKRILSTYGIDVPKFVRAGSLEEAFQFIEKHGYPVVAKIASYQVLHKSDVGGVETGIDNDESLKKTYLRFSRMEGFAGMLVEEMVSGMELMAGAKVDYQFGPVILFGMGGTGVEIYQDTTLRMAPLREWDVKSMIKNLKAHRLLEGYRGSKSINLKKLTQTLMAFSRVVMDIHEHIDSIDLNPVMCSPEKCIVADARIMLKEE